MNLFHVLCLEKLISVIWKHDKTMGSMSVFLSFHFGAHKARFRFYYVYHSSSSSLFIKLILLFFSLLKKSLSQQYEISLHSQCVKYHLIR